MTNEEKTKNMTKGFLKEGLIKKSRIQELLIKAMDWKEKQLIDGAVEWLNKYLFYLDKKDDIINNFKQSVKGE